MPRHYTSPRLSDKQRLALFRDGKCPYCNTACITTESRVVKYRPKKQEVVVYRCGVCGAEAKEGIR